MLAKKRHTKNLKCFIAQHSTKAHARKREETKKIDTTEDPESLALDFAIVDLLFLTTSTKKLTVCTSTALIHCIYLLVFGMSGLRKGLTVVRISAFISLD